jgi:hypothetical protein
MIRENRGFVWVPRDSYRLHTSVLINGTEVKTKVLSCSVTRSATNKAGSCTIVLYDKTGAYTAAFQKTQTIKIYADYSTGTTQIFEGFIREVNPEMSPYPKLTVVGHDYSGEALMRTVNKQYNTAMSISDVFKDLVASYLPTHTVVNVAAISTMVTPTFAGKKLLDCFADLMTLTENNYCFYCDFSKDWHVFEKGSVYNMYEPVVQGRNMIRIQTENTLSDVTNKITLYGQPADGYPLVTTVSDATSIAATGYVIQDTFKDTNITTYDSLVEKATEMLNSKMTGELKGKQAVARGMVGLNPGDSIYYFAPVIGLQGEYFVPEFTHEIIGGKVMRTTTQFQVQHFRVADLSTVIKGQAQATQALMSIENADDLENSYVYPFNDSADIETMTDTQVTAGALALTAGSSTGSMITNSITAASNITKVQVKVTGWNLGDSTFEVSVNGGLDYEAATLGAVTVPGYSGSTLKVRVTLNSTAGNPSPNIDTMAVLYT